MACFFWRDGVMIPTWFPWIIVGGFLFVLLSFVASKYKHSMYQSKQFMQDFISGSILIGFIGVLMPDVFPSIQLPSSFSMLSNDIDSDFDLQVGPPRLAGR
jgi:hypothetical protein